MSERYSERILAEALLAVKPPPADGRPGPVRRSWPAAVAAVVRRGPAAVVRRGPAAVTRADLVTSAGALVSLAALGVAMGWIWSRIAPPERVGRTENGQLLPLVDESYHRFDDLAVFLLMGLAAGLVTAVVLWLLPRRRGPVVLLAVVTGSLVAAWLAARSGVLFANGQYSLPRLPGLGVPFDQAPRLESSWALIGQPLAASMTYGALAAWNGRDDLARHDGKAADDSQH